MAAPYTGTGGSSEAVIAGIDIDKLAKGFAEEANILKNYVTKSKTKAREIRYYLKAGGYLDTTDTTDTTLSQIAMVSSKALPHVIEIEITRATAYVKKFFASSPLISMEDIKDSDIDIFGMNVRDITTAVVNQVDKRIFSVISEAAVGTPTVPNPSNVPSALAVADGWNDLVTGDPITDIMTARESIRSYRYNPDEAIIYMNQAEERHLITYLITTKGSSIPQFSSEKVKTGKVMELLGCQVVVSANAPTDWVYMWVPNRCATWKSFMPITAAVIDHPGLGKVFRVWEEGECIMHDPKAAYAIEDTIV